MQRITSLLLIMIAVPMIAFGVAFGVLWKGERDWQAALVQRFPTASAEQRAALTLQGVCQDPSVRKGLESVCSYVDYMRYMRFASLLIGMAGLGWLGLIALAGRLARTSRILLLRIFRPGLHLTNLFLIVLIAVHAILAIVALYFGESALIGRIHFGVIIVIGLGALAGVAAIAKVSFFLVRTVTTAVIGKPISPQQAPELWAFVRDLSKAVDVQPPEHIVVGLDPNFFVTEAHVGTLDGELQGRTMFMSLPLSRILTRAELQGVIGHELGHYKGQDTQFSQKFYPIYRGTLEGLQALSTSGGEGAGNIALLPAFAMLSFFLNAFAVAENTISRERELAADKVGAVIAGPKATAAALVKVYAFSGYWPLIRNEMVEVIQEGKIFTNVGSMFANLVSAMAKPEALSDLDERRLSHPTDSHPPLSLRLQNLGVSLQDVQAPALQISPERAAITLVPDYEKAEEGISRRLSTISLLGRWESDSRLLTRRGKRQRDDLGPAASLARWGDTKDRVVMDGPYLVGISDIFWQLTGFRVSA